MKVKFKEMKRTKPHLAHGEQNQSRDQNQIWARRDTVCRVYICAY